MSKMYDIEVKVVAQKGTCGAGHKVSDKWTVASTTPAGICLSAYHVMETNIEVLKYGGSFPWNSDPDVSGALCPDIENQVVFELRRIRKK